jgi:hypothetical protein
MVWGSGIEPSFSCVPGELRAEVHIQLDAIMQFVMTLVKASNDLELRSVIVSGDVKWLSCTEYVDRCMQVNVQCTVEVFVYDRRGALVNCELERVGLEG